ncbi:MAG: hypothetical protein M3R06_04245 [Chloroflexota bacterium]|nr:hypothetical protein [Chloroflexota bacterium]
MNLKQLLRLSARLGNSHFSGLAASNPCRAITMILLIGLRRSLLRHRFRLDELLRGLPLTFQ